MLKHTTSTTFKDCGTGVFVKYVQYTISDLARLDLVWERYLNSSLKGHTQEKRGKGTRRQVSGSIKIPCNWQEFLRINKNRNNVKE